ncbi:hypothetical protein ACQJBY_001864 [Aegilops geniculata]
MSSGRSGVRGWRGEKTDREKEDGQLGSGQITPPLLSLPHEANPHLLGSHATSAHLLVSLLRLFLRAYLGLQQDGSKGGEQDGWPADFFEGSGAQGRRRGGPGVGRWPGLVVTGRFSGRRRYIGCQSVCNYAALIAAVDSSANVPLGTSRTKGRDVKCST